jgi:FKBP-type peptidyl-prolyl cis-trans isomerase
LSLKIIRPNIAAETLSIAQHPGDFAVAANGRGHRPMRKYGIIFILGGILAFLAFQARTGIFRLKNPGEPANKWVRQQMEAQRLTAEELRIINDKWPDATVTPSGLRYVVTQPGTGEPAPRGTEIAAHYDGTLLDGTRFDSSRERGEPFRFRVGTGAVIAGWEEAFATMKRGEKRVLIVPWWLGYGQDGKGAAIPPRSTLVFDVELVGFGN